MENEDELDLFEHSNVEDEHRDYDRVVFDLEFDRSEELDRSHDQDELEHLEVEYKLTDRERSLASDRWNGYLSEKLGYRRDGVIRSCGPCYKRTNLVGTRFKGRRGANKRAQANAIRRADPDRVRP